MSERVIIGAVDVNASRQSVWEAWTTEEGITSFFAPACKINIRVNGAYELYFNPSAPEGERGGEGVRILALQPPEMISFTWNAPPHLPEARGQNTSVILRLEAISENRTRVHLHHSGWGSGGEWDEAYNYFTLAWNNVVLPRLSKRFTQGPVDWSQK